MMVASILALLRPSWIEASGATRLYLMALLPVSIGLQYLMYKLFRLVGEGLGYRPFRVYSGGFTPTRAKPIEGEALVPADRLRRVSVVTVDHLEHLRLTYDRDGREVELTLDQEEVEDPLGAILALSAIAPDAIDGSVEPYLDPEHLFGDERPGEMPECALDADGACPRDEGGPCSMTGEDDCLTGYRSTSVLSLLEWVDGRCMMAIAYGFLVSLLLALFITTTPWFIEDPGSLWRDSPELTVWYIISPVGSLLMGHALVRDLRGSYRRAWGSPHTTVVPGGVLVPNRFTHWLLLRTGPIVPLASIAKVERLLSPYLDGHEHLLRTVGGDRFWIQRPLYSALAEAPGFVGQGFSAVNSRAAPGPQPPLGGVWWTGLATFLAAMTLFMVFLFSLPYAPVALSGFLLHLACVSGVFLALDLRRVEVERLSHGLRVTKGGISVPLARGPFRTIGRSDVRSATVVRRGGSLALAVVTTEGVIHLPATIVADMRWEGMEVQDPRGYLEVDG